ncbi:hypothetical protein TcCL_Unassigned03829 [Trypanosoma cruzi]|nr:hypothetical protein TcCL_Unassigned03829 [Trypanosoma cruzi]
MEVVTHCLNQQQDGVHTTNAQDSRHPPRRKKKETHRHRLQLNHAANRIRPRPCRKHTTLTEPAIAQKATRAGGSLSIHEAAPHPTRSHKVHHVNRKRDSRCALSLPSFPLTPTEESGSCTQLQASSTKEASTCTAMCVSCACGCVRPLRRSTT